MPTDVIYVVDEADLVKTVVVRNKRVESRWSPAAVEHLKQLLALGLKRAEIIVRLKCTVNQFEWQKKKHGFKKKRVKKIQSSTQAIPRKVGVGHRKGSHMQMMVAFDEATFAIVRERATCRGTSLAEEVRTLVEWGLEAG